MNELPKVLVIEDHSAWRSHFVREFAGWVTLLQARTVEEARQLFAEHPDVRVVALDGCLRRIMGSKPDTLPLIDEFRLTFGGTMIAMSTDEKFRHMMVEAGCTCSLDGKEKLPEEVKRLLAGG
ncbi:hypothetical protein KKD80_02680 [Patescibacteria group bacterium]|nr:hypothetical protein [Patescibacteria group bacterium]